MGEEFKRVEGNKIEQKDKVFTKKFTIKFIIFLIILTLITSLAIYFTIKTLDKKDEDIEVEEIKENAIIEEIENKKIAEDKKYALTSYTETYDMNDLEIMYYYDLNGKISTEWQDKAIQFIQIKGLKDKDIQKKINETLKEESYKISSTYVQVTANFANVLSVYFYDEGKTETLNIDLTTGQDIPFEKVFVSSAPINLLLGEALYEELAWNRTVYSETEEYINDMDKIDMSDYEDKVLLLVNNYNRARGNIKYSIYPSEIVVYGLTDKIFDTEYEVGISLKFLDHIEEIAIYKRYLTAQSIFEENDIGSKNIIVLTGILDSTIMDEYTSKYVENITYGKIEDNIFLHEILELWYFMDTDDTLPNAVRAYIEELSEENKGTLKKEVSKDKGIIAQTEYSVSKDDEDPYYYIYVTSYKATCSISYFKNKAFRDYAEMKAYPRADLGINAFSPYMQDEFPNLEISEYEWREYYVSETGEFLGNTEEEVNKKTEPQEEVIQEENTNVVESNNNIMEDSDVVEDNNDIIEGSNIVENNNNIIENSAVYENSSQDLLNILNSGGNLDE